MIRCNASWESLWIIPNWRSVIDTKQTTGVLLRTLKVGKFVYRKFIRLNYRKCQVLHLRGLAQELVQARRQSKVALKKKACVSQWITNLSVSQQGAKKANHILSCAVKSTAGRLREVIFLSSQTWWNTSGVFGPVLASQLKRDITTLEWAQW